MSLAHVYPIIFTLTLLSLHCWSTTTHPTDATSHMSLCNHLHPLHLPSLHWTSLAYLMDIWCMIHMFTVPLLVTSCALPWPNQSQIIMPCSQALTIASLRWALCSFLVYHLYLTCLYLPFTPENWIYEFPPAFRFSASALPFLAFASPHFTLHHIASQSHHLYLLHHTQRQSLTPRLCPPSLIGFMLRLPAPSILAAS